MTHGEGDRQPEEDHALSGELRGLFDALADLLEPVLRSIAEQGGQDSGSPSADGERVAAQVPVVESEHSPLPSSCHWCPLCALIALGRGERPELAVRAAEHAGALIALVRTAMADHEGAGGWHAGYGQAECNHTGHAEQQRTRARQAGTTEGRGGPRRPESPGQGGTWRGARIERIAVRRTDSPEPTGERG